MDYQKFEILTKQLLEKRLKKEFNKIIPVFHQKAYTSLSGNTYKIDLSYVLNICDLKYLTIIECKYWNSNIGRDKIGYFKSIIDDLKANKGIIVTSTGFQKGAIDYAKSNNIGLVKIVNETYFNTIEHIVGKEAEIEKLLLQIDNITYSKPLNSYGVFGTSMDVLDFIGYRYSTELFKFLKFEFTPELLDTNDILSDFKLKKELSKIPENWTDEYTHYETGGLNYLIDNYSQLRILNISIRLLKYKFGIE